MPTDAIPFDEIYNSVGIATGTTSASASIPSLSTVYNSVSDPTAPQSLGSGYFANDIFSSNYKQGVAGWKLAYNGDFEGNSGVFRGTLTANSLNIPDTTSANSFHVDLNGNTWWGSNVADFISSHDNAFAYVLDTGIAKFQKVTISGGSNVTFISDTIDTSSKKILKDFTFGSTDYSGAFRTGSITWDTATGSITGGSGILMNKGGIVGANAGVPKFTIDATTGAITSFTLTTGTITLDSAGYLRGGQTDYNTGTGFFLGYSGGAYKFSIGNPAGQYLTWDGTNLAYTGYMATTTQFSASNNLKCSSDAGSGGGLQDLIRVKEMQMGWGGTVRVYFEQSSGSDGRTAQGQIYLNRVAVGTLRISFTAAYTAYTEDITVTAGSLLQLYGTCSFGSGTWRYFRVSYDRAAVSDSVVTYSA